MLFFFAGYEIDFERIRGEPLRLGALGWLLSLVLAYAIGGVLAAMGIVLSLLFVGSAMATTAIGTLIPILSDAGELKSRFGTYMLGAGAMGEFGPILLITLVFSTTKSELTNALILVAFVVVAVLAGVVAVRSMGRGWEVLEQTLETSSQLAIRVTVVIVFALAALASQLGLDLLLGGFVAGIILRLALRGHEVNVLESKLVAVGYGFLIPFFFVVSGISVNLHALVDHPVEFLKVPMFLALFLIVRGTPALLLYRTALRARERVALALFSATELPLIVAITTIAIHDGHMRSSTAASLILAAICSTALYPILGLRLRAATELETFLARGRGRTTRPAVHSARRACRPRARIALPGSGRLSDRRAAGWMSPGDDLGGTAVEVDALKVVRGGRAVLRGISLRVGRGAVTGLLGPSGSGKSTLMRAIVGVQVLAGGRVTVLGEAAGSPGLRRGVGYVTQAPSVYGDITVEENLRYFASVVGVGHERIAEVIETVGLAGFERRVVGSLSGGERSRVSLATALLGDPELLVLDEPTVGLDPVLRAELWQTFHALAAAGRTLLVSSHVMDEASACDTLLLLRDGALLAQTTPAGLREQTGEQDLGRAFLAVIEQAGAGAAEGGR